MPFSYANPTSGPSAGGIGWFNFENLSMNPGDTVTGLTGTLNNGNIVTFDMSLTLVSGTARQFNASPVPTYPIAQFGGAGYTGLAGNVAMYAALADGNTAVSNFTISNITVKDALNNPIPNYTVLIADAESTNLFEGIRGQTNGGGWSLFTVVGSGSSPNLNGIGSQTFDITGNQQFGQVVAYVLSTQTPSQIVLTMTDLDPVRTRQAFSIGFATTRLRLQKNIGQRIDPSDQFVLNITGNPTDQVVTMGATNGIQAQFADVYVSPGNSFLLNEVMASGSASQLTDYTQTISAANATLAGSVPPITSLPITFTPALGDDVTYTILNAAPEVFVKSVDKAFADVGEVLTYTVIVENPNDFAVNNVLVVDTTPAGTAYIGNLTVSAPYTGTDPASGITITTIGATSSVTLSWQVQVNDFPPIPNPVPNYANVTVPGGASGMSNVVTTQVNTAFVSVLKTVDKVFASVGDVLTYTLTLSNAGNVSANNVVITDAIPVGTTFVPGSVTGATGTPPTLTLANPIPAKESTIVTFQVKIGDTVPNPNPIPNAATASYTYTINPANPNGAQRNANSNIVNTTVSSAIVSTSKAVDKAFAAPGDILTYTITLQNSGNVDANNIVITDAVPAGATFVPGSVIGATGIPPVLTLVNPIVAGGSTTVSFQVQIGNTVPVQNPIPNAASTVYTFTVDPRNPNGGSGGDTSNMVNTQVNSASVSTIKSVDKAYADINGVLTYTLILHNTGNTSANNVVITDVIPQGTTFIAGSVVGALGTPPTLILANPIAGGGSSTVTFQVQVGNVIPNPNPIPNFADVAFTYTINPENPNAGSGGGTSNIVTTQINHADITPVKEVDNAYAKPGDILTYMVTIQNQGNVTANNVVLTDAVPAGTSFVPGSVTGAIGVPPTLTVVNPIAAGGAATVTFRVKIIDIPAQNPIPNTASVAYAYTVDPTDPNGTKGTVPSNPVTTQVSIAKLSIIKTVDKNASYLNDIITYKLAVTNTGNVAANNVVLNDILPAGVVYVLGTLIVSVPFTGMPDSLQLSSPILPGQTVGISFKVRVVSIPNPNPIINQAIGNFTYTVIPNDPNGEDGTVTSNKVCTLVFRYHFEQQIMDIIESVAMEEAALAVLMNAEGSKIQKMVSMGTVDTHELLCLNQSVADTMDSITMLETILRQKINIVNCQIQGCNM